MSNEEKITILIRQFAYNPNADFSVETWLKDKCLHYITANDYEIREDVQNPKMINKNVQNRKVNKESTGNLQLAVVSFILFALILLIGIMIGLFAKNDGLLKELI